MATVSIPSSGTTTMATGGLTLTPTSTALATQNNYVSALTTAALSLHKRDVHEELVKRYGDQGITGLLEMVGAKAETSQTNFEHYEEAFIHNSVSVTLASGTAIDAATAETLNLVDGDNTDQLNGNNHIDGANEDMPFRPGDVLLTDKNDQLYVLSTTPGSTSAIKVLPLNTASALTGYPTAGTAFKVSIIGNMFPEATVQPLSLLPRVHTYKNSVMIMKESFEVSGSEATNVTYFKVDNEHLGSGYMWYLKGEQDTYRRFLDYAEIMMVVGDKVANTNLTGSSSNNLSIQTAAGSPDSNTATLTGSEGLIPFISNNGQSMDLGSASITMADFDAIVKSLDKYRGSMENALYAGINLSLDIDDLLASQTAVSAGGANYGTFNNDVNLAVNLGFNSFTRGGYTFHKKTYDLFNHPKLLGMDSLNYPGYGICIPMDSRRDARSGEKIPSLRIRYKAVPGYSREMEHWLTGSAVLQNKTETSDVLKSHYRTERGFEGFAANRFLLIKKS